MLWPQQIIEIERLRLHPFHMFPHVCHVPLEFGAGTFDFSLSALRGPAHFLLSAVQLFPDKPRMLFDCAAKLLGGIFERILGHDSPPTVLIT
jgi:hypothetical protein